MEGRGHRYRCTGRGTTQSFARASSQRERDDPRSSIKYQEVCLPPFKLEAGSGRDPTMEGETVLGG